MNRISLCADVGGSHITCRLFNLDTNTFADGPAINKEVDSQGTAAHILNAWAEAIAATAGNTPVNEFHGIGFAMPGPFDYPQGIGLFSGVQKFDALYGVNIKQELSRRLHLPDTFRIRFQNDATCFAIGESLIGEVSRHSRMLAITLGTGFGTTFVANQRPVAGADGVPADGFLYHIAVGNGIADDWFSTRWFLNSYRAETGQTTSGVKQLADMASGNILITNIFTQFGKNLGQFLAPWLMRFDAGGLVIGGNISAAYPLFGDALNHALQSAGCTTSVFISSLHQDAALCGSAILCNDVYYESITSSTQEHH